MHETAHSSFRMPSISNLVMLDSIVHTAHSMAVFTSTLQIEMGACTLNEVQRPRQTRALRAA